MSAAQALLGLRGFDVENATLSFWTFKKSSSQRGRFKAFSVGATEELGGELKRIAAHWINRCTEAEDYNLLALVNESSCLHVEADETLFPQLQDAVDMPPEEQLIDSVKELEGSVGYIARLQSRDEVLYCVCRLTNDWKVTKRLSFVNVILNGNQLDLAQNEAFTIAKRFDFFVLNSNILVTNKANFESVLEYKQTYAMSFTDLQQDAGFSAIFSDMTLLVEHVGTNTMHLRRMAVVKEREFYNSTDYMSRLRQVSQARQWNIDFDNDGKIVPTPESVRSIIQVLLNHRLHSELTDGDFDVASASPVT
jgi:hypothetical protein